eukprot:Blabericola_migrator_1__10327@NODE_580_length_7497_cov_126_900135_g430_i0_p4_GENE_NODE_580_length_7497_cov_126_900135_g430_i0NODE_580_length_7497_cov_126_900135_g430_i0_p4_ORF_typecomplete_len345_score93_63VWA_2/PF13519_6/1_5e12VWA_2/PF13519_6/1_9e03Ssl1/PF04056_14/6e09VWA/PF00092_28/0_002VWA/PF00092_28/1_2e04Med25_VWA/PF11265_8/0_01PDH/PF02153_17/0_048RE_R_Pab1/PF09522_10/0_096UIM/PF02809_20/28UIM/PF02809_20/7_8Rubissubsbind/PF09273_11/5_2e03Rubissubsbind/PF09273_11/4_2_NODE_580_length_7497_cov
MVLEATMICVDNSDWARNGDFAPSRLDAQYDTANLLGGAKTQSNPENAVGLLTMACKRVTVAIAPTTDMGAFLQALHNISCFGKCDFIRALQTAQLALKHRLNRNQRQRIVVFVCSPIEATEKQMELIGKTLKKNNISLDIISFGEVQNNSSLLKKLYMTVNSNDTSHLLEVTENSSPLTRTVLQSAIVADETGQRMTDQGLDEFGVDPSADPELYMALRLSLEDERARSRRAQQQAPEGMQTGHVAPQGETAPEQAPQTQASVNESGDAAGVIVTDTPPMGSDVADDKPPSVEDIMAMDIDEELRQALLLSLKEYAGTEEEDDKQMTDGDNQKSSQNPESDKK